MSDTGETASVLANGLCNHRPSPSRSLGNGITPGRLASSKGQRMVHACDCCRRRKLKCDTRQPSCANCENAGMVCQSLTTSRKRGRKAARLPSELPVIEDPESSNVHSSRPAVDVEQALREPTASSCEQGSPGTHGSFSGMEEAMCQQQQQQQAGSSQYLTPSFYQEIYNAEQNSQCSPQIPDTGLDDDHLFPNDGGPALSATDHHPLLADLAIDISAAGIRHDIFAYITMYVNVFFDNIYPTYPVIYRPTITWAIKQLATPGGWDIKNFTLVTSLCAYTCAILPAPISIGSWQISEIFYRSSKKALDFYRNEDIENPDSISIIVRSFHSGWLHASGKSNASWHTMGEAVRIAQVMRLHDEESYARMPQLEGQLCRRVFWTLFTGDKSAAVLGGHPICLQSDFFRNRLKVRYPEDFPDQDIVTYQSASGTVHNISIMTGFNANQDLWRAAETLLTWDADEVVPMGGAMGGATPDIPYQHSDILAVDFVKFRMCLEGLPSCLRFYNSFDLSPLDFVFSAQGSRDAIPRALSIQRTNLQISYLCLKMVILRKFPMLYKSPAFGLSIAGSQLHQSSPQVCSPQSLQMSVAHDRYSTPSFAIEVLQVAEDMMYMIHTSSLELIRVNGEACVEKIRLVGAAVLELIANNPPQMLSEKAEKYRELYPHILALLESKASDAASRRTEESPSVQIGESHGFA